MSFSNPKLGAWMLRTQCRGVAGVPPAMSTASRHQHEGAGRRLVALVFDLERRRSLEHEEELVVLAVDVRCCARVVCGDVDDGDGITAVGLRVVHLETELQPFPEGEAASFAGPEDDPHRAIIPRRPRLEVDDVPT